MKPEFNISNVITIAKKEFMDNLRNNWIMILTFLFIILTLVISFVSGGGSLGDIDITVIGLLAIASLLVPIIAIMLGYNTISGEAESRSLLVVQSYPVSREDVYFGKFLGLGSVLAVSVLLGFGISGMVIVGTGGGTNPGGFLVFIFLTILLGLIYLSMSVCFSAILKRRSTSLYAGVGLFFWSMIIGSVIMGIHLGTGGSFADFTSGGMPNWMWSSMMVLSPSDMYQTATMLGFDLRVADVSGFSIVIPDFISMANLLVIFIFWIVVPLGVGYYFYRKRDI
ncbi:MAG: ABC transporter permease subunit [candidate division Zixibacteria bacterium]|nr:ABC transporter permease subunit [candidate division Zixibacteria bacterium]